ncbi:hypothetical protein FIBSPDRAFT_900048 [Athelia psychrophila]|uniref:Uncharacterized protein n=1 Tax=Athelia psychrophila TaxID=1759441 RepID=A0A165YWJ1_9AGAM|nr:hypothetical protein FIBSPDRAFT_900048 [Fibularhizoctonia sp. CBS 109695]
MWGYYNNMMHPISHKVAETWNHQYLYVIQEPTAADQDGDDHATTTNDCGAPTDDHEADAERGSSLGTWVQPVGNRPLEVTVRALAVFHIRERRATLTPRPILNAFHSSKTITTYTPVTCLWSLHLTRAYEAGCTLLFIVAPIPSVNHGRTFATDVGYSFSFPATTCRDHDSAAIIPYPIHGRALSTDVSHCFSLPTTTCHSQGRPRRSVHISAAAEQYTIEKEAKAAARVALAAKRVECAAAKATQPEKKTTQPKKKKTQPAAKSKQTPK